MAAVVGGVEEEASRMRAQTSKLQDIDQVGMEEMRQQDEGRGLRKWMEVSDDPVMVADWKLGSGFWHMNCQASYNPWNSKTRQAGVESAPRLRCT